MLASGAFLLAPVEADAHFILQSPASWKSQTLLGDPQKLGPCGDNGGTETGIVTAVEEGGMITVTIQETIFHPGHYRIALSVNDRSELPAEPPVTAGSTPCGSTIIQDPPVFPVLADGVFPHTKPLSGPQTIQIKLPDGVTCDHCTLQVIEFMSEHGLNDPGGCFYHHCADLAIGKGAAGAGGSGAGGTATAGAGGADTAGAGGTGQGAPSAPAADAADDGAGCGCAVPGGARGEGPIVPGLVALAWMVSRSRRRAARRGR